MRRENARVTITFCSLVVAGVVFAANATAASPAAGCTRETLVKLADTYVSAQKAGKPATIPLAANAYYGENDKAMDIAKGVLAGPLKVDFTRSLFDTTQCATFTELVAATDPHPYVIHTRMEATRDGKVSKMESVVTDQGDWVFGATEFLGFTRDEKWDEIPQDKRDTRQVIQAAADAYLNNWGNPDLPVPHGTPCAQLEGRNYKTINRRNPQGNACDMGAFPEKLNVTNRRYVIDETLGAVSIFHNFPWLDQGQPKDPGTQAAHVVRVEGGKNRYLHEITVCSVANCGRGAPAAPRQGGPGAGPGGPRQGGPGAPAAPGAAPAAPAPAPVAPGGA
jgi:hypothetical protein